VELFELPRVLTLQVKRFVYSEHKLAYEKMDHPVKFTKNLSIDDNLGKTAVYELFGVVHHSGSSEFGHYVAEVRDLE